MPKFASRVPTPWNRGSEAGLAPCGGFRSSLYMSYAKLGKEEVVDSGHFLHVPGNHPVSVKSEFLSKDETPMLCGICGRPIRAYRNLREPKPCASTLSTRPTRS